MNNATHNKHKLKGSLKLYCVFKRLKKNYSKNNLGVIKPGGPYKNTSDDIDKLIFDKRAKIKKALGLVRYAAWRGPGARLIPLFTRIKSGRPTASQRFHT